MSEPVQATVTYEHTLEDYDEAIQAIEVLNNLEIPFTLIYRPNAAGPPNAHWHRWTFEIRLTGELLAPEAPAHAETTTTVGI